MVHRHEDLMTHFRSSYIILLARSPLLGSNSKTDESLGTAALPNRVPAMPK
jgi:hypothetical protein